jgi:hypothetical protein
LFWIALISLTLLVSAPLYALWARGTTIQELVRNPPPEVDLPGFVTILSYLHHELIKHRLPLVSILSERPLEEISEEDLRLLREGVTGNAGRPDLLAELDGYLSGLQRASGRVHLNWWRDPMVRRARRACREIQAVAAQLEGQTTLLPHQQRRLRAAEQTLNGWFRPRLQALRSSVLSLDLCADLLEEPVERVTRELGLPDAQVELPRDLPHVQVRMLRPDFNLVVRNLIRNALQRSTQATGQARLALELDKRLELTGEEAVLLRIYDTDPTILSRQELYGGQIGRGLNLVTTTLQRYGGSLRSARSRREGFAKFMEARLLQADFDEAAAELLRRPDALARALPAALLLLNLAVAALAAAGLSGAVPDPIAWIASPGADDLDAARRDGAAAAASLPDRARALSRDLAAAIARQDPPAPTPLVPGPELFQVPQRRCNEPQRLVDERRVEIQCHLVENVGQKPGGRLEPPLLIFSIEPPEGDMAPPEARNIDLRGLSLTTREQITEDGQTRTLEPHDACVRVIALSPREPVPDDLNDLLKNSDPRVSAWSRLLVDYRPCLQIPRYPIQVTIQLSAPQPDAPVTTLKLNVQLRRPEDAEDAYLRISNEKRLLPERAHRMALVRAIARHVARQLEYARGAGTLAQESHGALAKAIYYGWVRPSVYEGLWARIDAQRNGSGPTPQLCALFDDIQQGVQRLQDPDLDPQRVRAERYRSVYYALHGRLWLLGDVQGAMQELDAFQAEQSKRTDFVQGARLYLAALLALTEPPGNEGDPQAEARLARMEDLLRQLQRDAQRPPRRGAAEERYDKIRLMGIQALLGDEEDESFTVDAALCGFQAAYPRWSKALDPDARDRLFSHCPSEDGDPPPDDAPPPDPTLAPGAERVQAYFEAFQKVIANTTWRCKEG